MHWRTPLLVATLALAAVAVGPGVGAGADAASGCDYPATVTDATGTNLEVYGPDGDPPGTAPNGTQVLKVPEEVVVLAPSTAQTVWEIGASDLVVGMPVNQYTAYLAGSDERRNVVGSRGYANVETVVGMTPDLVLAANINSEESVSTFRRAGIATYKFGAVDSLEDIYAKTNRTGVLTGHCAGAAATVAEMRANVSRVRSAVEGRERPDVFFDLGGGYTALPGTFSSAILETAGGNNVAAGLNTSRYGQVNPEVVVEADPDWIVVSYTGERPDDPASLLSSPALRNTTAAETGQVVAVNANYMNQPAPRVVRPLDRLARQFHPDAFPVETDGDDTTTAGDAGTSLAATDADPTGPGEGTTTAADEGGDSGGVPGFTPATAFGALALVVAGLLATRRH